MVDMIWFAVFACMIEGRNHFDSIFSYNNMIAELLSRANKCDALSFMGDKGTMTPCAFTYLDSCKVTNAFKIVTQALPTPSHAAHTWKTDMSRTRAMLTLQITLHSPMGFAKSDYQYAQYLLAQDVFLCYWSAPLLSVHSSSCSHSLSYHALFHMHSEAACLLNVRMPSLYQYKAKFINVYPLKFVITAGWSYQHSSMQMDQQVKR